MQVPAALAKATFPAPVLEVLRRLGEAGHRSWLVGGAVRDLLLQRQRPAKDFDVATPARPEDVVRIFSRVIPTGIEHGTVTVLAQGEPVEVTTFRGEGPYLDGRRPESVTFHQDLEADLSRRDFTMNALAFDPLAVEFRDPHGGREDLRRRIVRAVGDPKARFAEDGLRPMRAVRFVAQLGFELDPRTVEAIPGALEVVRRVALERLSDELSKLLVAPHAREALALFRNTGLLGVVLPSLSSRKLAEMEHVEAVASAAPPGLPERLAALLHRLGGAGAASSLAALRLSRAVGDEVQILVRAFPCLCEGGELLSKSPVEIRRWLAEVDPKRAEGLLGLAAAELTALSSGRRLAAAAQLKRLGAAVSEVLAGEPPLSIRELALDGSAVAEALGKGPGPHIGEALRYLLDRVLERPEENTPERLRAALLDWSASGGRRI